MVVTWRHSRSSTLLRLFFWISGTEFFIRGANGSETEEEDAEPRRLWTTFGPLCRQGAVVAEALAVSLGDSTGRPGKARWLMVSVLLGEECSLLFWLTALVRASGHLLAVGRPGGQCCGRRRPMQLSSAKTYAWPGLQSSCRPT